MTTVATVAPGTAENLAVLAHFRNLDLPETDTLDTVAYMLLGDVGDINARRERWEALRDVCDDLWHLTTDDWCDGDLDELTDDEWQRCSFTNRQQETDRRHELTVARLVGLVENEIWLARYAAAQAKRTAVTV